jgi:CelD/BcsL family acetyltransferase involved in cellulose biosynthesis
MIKIECVNDITEAERLWRLLSPEESIYDLWDLRYCFYKNDVQPLFFYTAYDDGEPVGLLPLQQNLNTEVECYEFFAENFTESNRPFVKAGYEYLIPQLFAAAPVVTKIYDILGVDDFTRTLPIEDYVYRMDISEMHAFDDYLATKFANAKKRSNFKRMFTILERDHEVKVIHNNFSDLELLMDLNVKHFGEESYLRTDKERQPFRDLLNLPLDLQMITIEVDGEKLAASLSIVHKDIYFYLIIGSDISKIDNAFKYLTKANLELALEKKLRMFNCALGACNWKDYWHLDKQPQYEFIKE